MHFLSRLLLTGVAALAAGAVPASAQSDDALVKLCQSELAERLSGSPAHGETFVVAKDIRHQAERVSIRLGLASGEGRRIAGTCFFRDGRLFDVKQQP